MVALPRHTAPFLVLYQAGKAGSTVRGARLAEVPPLFGTVYKEGALAGS